MPRQSTLLNKYGGTLTLPGGFRIRVEILDTDEEDSILGRECLAHYIHADHLIQLRRSRTIKQRRTDLEHELQHASVDWLDYFMRKAKVCKTR